MWDNLDNKDMDKHIIPEINAKSHQEEEAEKNTLLFGVVISSRFPSQPPRGDAICLLAEGDISP